MPVVTPSTVPVGMVRPWQSKAVAQVQRIAGPMPTGVTLVRTGGVWTQHRTPSADFLAAADLVLQGGHEYDIDQDTFEEILNAGFDVTVIST